MMASRIGLVLLIALSVSFSSNSQSILAWSPDVTLSLADFQSSETEIGGNLYSLYSTSKIDFAFQMSNYEFMLTKNFNDKVKCTFNRASAYLTAPDDTTAQQLIRFAQFDFDLAELYARKIRQRLYEEKGAFSNASFFMPVFNQLEQERADRHAKAAKATDIGRKEQLLREFHQQVRRELEEYPDFCQTCKPVKKKKR